MGELLLPPLPFTSSSRSTRLWQRGGVEQDDSEEDDRLQRRLSEEEIRWRRFSLAASLPPPALDSSWTSWSRSAPRLRDILLLKRLLSRLATAGCNPSGGEEVEPSLDSASSRSQISPVGWSLSTNNSQAVQNIWIDSLISWCKYRQYCCPSTVTL